LGKHSDKREIFELAAELQAKPDEQRLRRFKPDVPERQVNQPRLAAVEERAQINPGSATLSQPPGEVRQAEARADDICNQHDAPALHRLTWSATNAHPAVTAACCKSRDRDPVGIKIHTER
jgi:hypothetical protein